MNTLNIEIPEGKEIDWQESANQQKIVFKNKALTYQDIEDALPNVVKPIEFISTGYYEQLNAKIKLANTCRVLNDYWAPTGDEKCYYLCYNSHSNNIFIYVSNYRYNSGRFCFKTEELAKQAIEILGKGTVMLAISNIW